MVTDLVRISQAAAGMMLAVVFHLYICPSQESDRDKTGTRGVASWHLKSQNNTVKYFATCGSFVTERAGFSDGQPAAQSRL